jgi:chromosome partitioning protein
LGSEGDHFLLEEAPGGGVAAFVISRKIVGTVIGRDVIEALSAYPLPVLESAISQRVAFAESAARGMTVLEIDPNSPASEEVAALVREIKELYRGEKGKHSNRTP